MQKGQDQTPPPVDSKEFKEEFDQWACKLFEGVFRPDRLVWDLRKGDQVTFKVYCERRGYTIK